MRIVTYPEAEVPRDLREQVVGLQDQAWPSDPPSGLEAWHDPALSPRSVLLVDGEGRVVAALDILSKDVLHRGERYAASGLSAVVTDRERQRRGHGRRLVEAARGLIATSGADLGIFTCEAPLRSFYERAGWEWLAGTVILGGTREAPITSDRFDKVTLASFFSRKAKANSADFVGCVVELYPGSIDTLW